MSDTTVNFLPDYAEAVAVIGRQFRPLHTPPDWLSWTVVPLFVVAIVFAFLASAAVGHSLLPSDWRMPGSLALWAVTFGALVYISARFVRPWMQRRHVARQLQLLSAPRSVEIDVGATGLRIADEHYSAHYGWPIVEAAEMVPEGVYIAVERAGIFIPQRAFVDTAHQERFAAEINQRASATL